MCICCTCYRIWRYLGCVSFPVLPLFFLACSYLYISQFCVILLFTVPFCPTNRCRKSYSRLKKLLFKHNCGALDFIILLILLTTVQSYIILQKYNNPSIRNRKRIPRMYFTITLTLFISLDGAACLTQSLSFLYLSQNNSRSYQFSDAISSPTNSTQSDFSSSLQRSLTYYTWFCK